MKKHGKFEKKPVAAPAKPPKVKNLLLQTYFTSLVCMVLCASMFFGTSYAWFSSEVTNTTNEIYAGTLKVGLYKKTEGAEPVSLAGEKAPALFNKNVRWEPGYTELETIQVVNEGDLAFKYTLTFTDGAVEGYDLEELAENFEVFVFNHYGKTYTKPGSYKAICDSADWARIGTLDQVLNGEVSVLENKVMETVRKQGVANPNANTTDGVATTDTYTIALHMKEEAYDTKLMGKKLTLSVKLVAYQMADEKDSLGGTYEGDIIAVTDAKQLQEGLGEKKNVLLASNIVLDSETDCVVMIGGVLDGSGKKITYKGGKNASGNSVGVVTATGGTIRNLTIQGGDNGRALYVTNLASNLYVSDCKLSGAYAFNLNSAEKTSRTMTFVNTEFKSWTSFANAAAHVYFTDCTFAQTLRPYGDTTLTNCTFSAEMLDVSELEEGETITLINCVYNGKKIEKAVLTATAEGVKVTEGNVSVNEKYMVNPTAGN